MKAKPFRQFKTSVLEALVSTRLDRGAALIFLRKAMKRFGSPQTFVTDGLKSHDAALRAAGIWDRQETGRWRNNLAGNSHQPLRRRERVMQCFRRRQTLERFASVHSSVFNHFENDRHLNRRDAFKANRDVALAAWRQLGAD